MSSKRIIIAGGGTGGHIFPAVAIAQALLRIDATTELLFVGAKGRMEMEKIPQEGFKIIGLDIAGFNRYNLLKNLSLPMKLLKSRIVARQILRDFKPHVVVGVGGYASFPVLNAAQGMGIPTVIQEQNSYAGKSNKILGHKAKSVCVAYGQMERFFPKERIVITGNPVRKNIALMDKSREESIKWFGLNNELRTILVTGGSLGAKSVNEGIEAGLKELMNENVQLIWQTGKPFYEQAKKSAAEYGERVKVYDFIREMEYAYTAADIVVARAGALAIAELCIASKPVIFVPYPHAAEDHQTSNALALVKSDAAWMVNDADVKNMLVKKVKELLHNGAVQEIMTKKLGNLAIKDSDERIANNIMVLASNK